MAPRAARPVALLGVCERPQARAGAGCRRRRERHKGGRTASKVQVDRFGRVITVEGGPNARSGGEPGEG
eukprot:2156729-Pleurochrysis_carterae.AAC.1